MSSGKIVYDTGTMQVISHFERLTHARVKDCIVGENQVIFVVEPGDAGRAIGPKGANVRRLEAGLKKKVKIAEFSHELVTFIKNLVYPIDVREIREQEDGIVILVPPDLKARGLLIGRNAQTLRAYEAVVQRFFPVKELKVADYG
ncbi:MAG: NusA-like transcription termination signal-binding factor [Candidatus Woesearchaeota archaeon]